MHQEIQHIEQLLNEDNIKGMSGFINFHFGEIKFTVSSKDIIGNILQEWFENWMIVKNIPYSKPSNTQEWPDFFVGNHHLEIKTFNYDSSPAFDIGGFDAYTRSLLEHPQRLDTYHLIFGYRSTDKSIEIVDFWIKKVWEMTGKSKTNCLELQVKQNIPTNIRPKNWRNKNLNMFTSKKEFVSSLQEALTKFYPTRYQIENINWLQSVEAEYFKKTNTYL